MSWKITCSHDQRIQFISDCSKQIDTMSSLCRDYGISRKTGYKWLNRYMAEGIGGLIERSRAPNNNPRRITDDIRKRIVTLKLSRQKYGPKKLHRILQRDFPGMSWPVPSTIGEILKQEGLVMSRKPRSRTPAYTEPFLACDQANKVWSADFKGEFKMKNSRFCYPLTISDNYSRFLLQCRALDRTSCNAVQPWFEWTFRKYGLPEAIRTDNGAPFASVAAGGLSALSIWFIKLGIRVERIRPGYPQQNGRHERMHRTLKDHALADPAMDLSSQQKNFDRFLKEYNEYRPHESLSQDTPSTLYICSERSFPNRLPPIEYDENMEVRTVKKSGEISWKGKHYYIFGSLAGEKVGLKQSSEEEWLLCFNYHKLGYLNLKKGKFVKCPSWLSLTRKKAKEIKKVLPMSSV